MKYAQYFWKAADRKWLAVQSSKNAGKRPLNLAYAINCCKTRLWLFSAMLFLDSFFVPLILPLVENESFGDHLVPLGINFPSTFYLSNCRENLA